MSVDEAYIDVSEQPAPEVVAIGLAPVLRAETGLPCSVGLATCKLVAKVASDFDKPEGCTIVAPGQEAAFLAPLPTRALHGVGPRTAERLAGIGIGTCGELADADPTRLRRVFGDHALSLIRRARGIDRRPVVVERGEPKSISQERTFATDVADGDWLRAKLAELSERVAASLQRQQLVAHTVTVKFRWDDFTTFTRQRSTSLSVDDAELITRMAHQIFDEHWPPGQQMRLIGVGVSNLAPVLQRALPLRFPPEEDGGSAFELNDR
jgi:DNA polymerase-4